MESKQEKITKIIQRGAEYQIQDGTFFFLNGNTVPVHSAGSSSLGLIKDYLKKYGFFYNALKDIFKPVWVNRKCIKVMNALLKQYGVESITLNLGSGPGTIKGRSDIINIDIYNFNDVDVVADATNLPFVENSVDFIINRALLEHVESPERVIQEMYRILKPGGSIFCFVPFIQPYHAAPFDFQRWTVSGVIVLFEQFQNISVGIGSGPTSGMLWVIQPWLALLLSFKSKIMHDMIFIFLMALTFPVKILDSVLVKHPYANNIAGGFYIVAKKS